MLKTKRRPLSKADAVFHFPRLKFMLFSWLKKRRRRKILNQPFPKEWSRILATNVRHAAFLTNLQQQQLKQFVQIFVAEKNWEGCNGLKMTDEVRVTIAAQAGLLMLGLPDAFFDHVLSILVYPDEYIQKEKSISTGGIVTEQTIPMLGQAEWQGPVVLSWADTLAGGRGESPGDNLVLHEFAHQLDMMNGRFVDGIPPVSSADELRRWSRLFEAEYQQLVEKCQHGHPTAISCYGTQNEAEFFAVLTEAFFERPLHLQQDHEECYQLLADYFRVDPAEWQ